MNTFFLFVSVLMASCFSAGYGLRCYSCKSYEGNDACARGTLDKNDPSKSLDCATANPVCVKSWHGGTVERKCDYRGEAMGCTASRCVCDSDLCNGAPKTNVKYILVVAALTTLTFRWISNVDF